MRRIRQKRLGGDIQEHTGGIVSNDRTTQTDCSGAPGYELFRQLRSGVAVYEPRDDGADFVIVDFNPAAERISDTPADALVGRSVLEMFPAVEDFGLFDVFQRVWSTGTPELLPVARYSDGRVDRWVRNFVYRTSDGHVVAVFDDMTGHMDADDVAQRERQRLQAISTLAGGVAHEINNPLHTILAAAEFLEAELGERSPELAEYAQVIREQGRRVSGTISGLLAFSRQDRGGQMATPLRPIVEGALTLIKAQLMKSEIALEVDLPSDLPFVRCHAQQIQQVVLNLLQNAREALASDAPRAAQKRRIAISAKLREEAAQTWLRLTIEDNGPGIPAVALPRVAEPFFTTRSLDDHTGLGLSVAHGIMADHAGTLSVDSAPGTMTRVFVEFPVLQLGILGTPHP